MYSFEGEFRTRPHQNLGGLRSRPEREKLLRHAHEERQKRQTERRRLAATTHLQAFARGCLQRTNLRSNLHMQFDSAMASPQSEIDASSFLSQQMCRLLFLYRGEEDAGRLMALSKQILKQRDKVVAETAAEVVSGVRVGGGWIHRLRRLLWRHLQLLVHLSKEAQPGDSPAISLRIWEVFGMPKTWVEVVDEAKATALLVNVYTFIIFRGYFHDIRFLLEAKVPPMLEKSPRPPTPLSASILAMLFQPLDLFRASSDQNFQKLVSRNLCAALLAPRPSETVSNLVIPALCNWPQLPFYLLVDTLAGDPPPTDTSCSPWLLRSLLQLAQLHLDTPHASSFLRVLVHTLDSIPPPLPSSGSAGDQGTDSDSEDEEEPSLTEGISREEKQCLDEGMELLNDPRMVTALMTWLDQLDGNWSLEAVCRLCHVLLLSDRLAAHRFPLLYTLAFRPHFLHRLWAAMAGIGAPRLLQAVAEGVHLSHAQQERLLPPLATFCSLFSYLLVTLHDSEFYGEEAATAMPFTLAELPGVCRQLRDVCLGLVDLAFPDQRPAYREATGLLEESSVRRQWVTSSQVWSHLLRSCVGLLAQLHARDARRPFCPEGHWISSKVSLPFDRPTDLSCQRQRFRGYRPFHLYHITRQQLEQDGPPPSIREVRLMTVLREIPFVVPFAERVEVLQQLVLRDRAQQQGGEAAAFLQGPSIQILVRRSYLYEDAFDKLSPENEPNLKLKMRVQLVNAAGVDEAGIDGGGLFREFLSEVLRTGFDPNRGFFRLTHDNLLYPNPSVHLLLPPDQFPRHYYFLGRLLGKALYENMLVELPLAHFFLAKLLARSSANVDIHHLASLDPLMHRNLLSLKNYPGDVADLGLDFTLLAEELGETRVEELKLGGAQIPVTASNRIEYIHLVADFKLNRQIRAQCNAFRQGLANVIPLEWLHMFSCKELQVLISGARVPIDVDDLRDNCVYSGGYTSEHPTIRLFWKVVESFTDQQRRQLLKFVTSCSRPPLLGFRELYPPFCVQSAGSEERLPTASTCMNLLKLPEFSEEHALREKLIYALESGSGFELS